MSGNKYATLTDVARAVEKLEEKVPSRWEVRSLILGLAGKLLSVVFLRS
jgi:hypothetical protein